ncbi:ribosomal maturation YjgA family protein [Psychroserpens sp.]
MKFKINTVYLTVSGIFLFTEICIAVFLTDGFIRHTFGDFLAVILLYCIIRSFIEASPIYITISVLIFAFIIEFSQLYNLLDYLHLRDHKLATIILGSTFHISDLIAYTLGTITILIIDLKTTLWKP